MFFVFVLCFLDKLRFATIRISCTIENIAMSTNGGAQTQEKAVVLMAKVFIPPYYRFTFGKSFREPTCQIHEAGFESTREIMASVRVHLL